MAYKAASMFTGPNWCVRCSRCGVTVTKYCFDEEEALQQAAVAIAQGECRCPKRDPETTGREAA